METAFQNLLVISGMVTALAGLPAIIVTQPFLRIVFGIGSADAAMLFFVRHWGVLISVVGVLLVATASSLPPNVFIVGGAAAEKFAIAGLVFFGPLKRTPLMTIIAVADGSFALAYTAYLFSHA